MAHGGILDQPRWNSGVSIHMHSLSPTFHQGRVLYMHAVSSLILCWVSIHRRTSPVCLLCSTLDTVSTQAINTHPIPISITSPHTERAILHSRVQHCSHGIPYYSPSRVQITSACFVPRLRILLQWSSNILSAKGGRLRQRVNRKDQITYTLCFHSPNDWFAQSHTRIHGAEISSEIGDTWIQDWMWGSQEYQFVHLPLNRWGALHSRSKIWIHC